MNAGEVAHENWRANHAPRRASEVVAFFITHFNAGPLVTFHEIFGTGDWQRRPELGLRGFRSRLARRPCSTEGDGESVSTERMLAGRR